MYRVFFLFVAFNIFLFLSCNSFKSKTQNADTTIHKVAYDVIKPGSFNDSSGIAFDSNAIQKFLAEKPLFNQFKNDFDTFYKANHYSYVWYDKNGLIETSGSLISGIQDLEEEGVTSRIPYKDSLDQLLYNTVNTSSFKPDINTELMLTGQYFNYAKKIWEGSLNAAADSVNWYLPRKKLSYPALLESNLSEKNIGDNMGPVVGPQYEGLKKALALYRNINKSDNEVVIPLISKAAAIKPNTSSPVVSSLRKRLLQLGDLNNGDTGSMYNAQLATIIKQVKPRYGLKPDSLITNDLIASLNVPAKNRIDQIMVNMERLRWIPVDTIASEFILVNIPQYTLIYYENDKPVWRCGVVVGKPMTKTVIFSGDLQYVVFSPYWNIPTSIVNAEVKPGMKRNPNYLAAHNMEWNGGRVRQKPGPNNSLGLVKFLFPNSNNIYLHDTPAKSLFNENERAFSHGCVRVSQPEELAIRVLKQDPQWTPQKIDAAMHAGIERTVTLKNKIPVYIGYFTAFIGPDSQVNFRADVYKRDNSLLDMLLQN